MEHNPFAPPSATDQPPPSGGLVFSPEGAAVVSSLAQWMRALSLFIYLGAGLMTLGMLSTCAVGGGVGVAVNLVLFIVVMLVVAAATWLRSAASGFERGVFGDDEGVIGQGFRSLRAYLILFGVMAVLTLMVQVYQTYVLSQSL